MGNPGADVESRRLKALKSCDLLDTGPEPLFDSLTALAADLFDAPIATVSLIDEDRQWFKARQGLDAVCTPRDEAFCAHAIELEPHAVMVVEDATRDPRFDDNPSVVGAPFIRFYAGALLTTQDGYNLGTLCVIDTRPRPTPSSRELARLKALAALVVEGIELSRRRREGAQRERLLELAGAMAGIGHWRLDIATGAVNWSDEVYRIHGVTRAGFDPNLDDALDFYEGEDRVRIQDQLECAIRDRTGFSSQLRIRRADGEMRDVTSRAACEFDDEGRLVAMVGVFQDVTHQVGLLRQVSEDRERYRLLTDHATDVIASYRPDGTFTFLSPAIARLIGRTPDDLLGRRTFEVIDPRDHARVKREFAALVASGDGSARIEYRAVKADGEVMWLEAHPTPIRDPGGRLTGFQDVVRDVTARREAQEAATEASVRAEAALVQARESEARYRLLAENANDMIATTGMDSTVLFVTPAVERLLGYAPAEVVGRKTLDLTHPDDVARVTALFEGLVVAGPSAAISPYQFRGRHKDGRWVWLEGQPRVQFDARGRPVAFQDVVRDIEERKRVEEAMLAAATAAETARAQAAGSEARYRLLAENATDVIGRYAVDGTILYISPACREVLGFEPEELLGRRTLDLIHPDDLDRIRAQFAAYVAAPAGAPPIQTEHRVTRSDGRVVWLEGRPRLVRDAQGRPAEFHDVMRDITARRAMEDDLEEARRAAEAAGQAKADFLANMSHELRTPLGSIIGFAGLIAEAPELAPATRRRARIVSEASRSLVAIVNDILDASKIEAEGVTLAPEPVELDDLLESACELVGEAAREKGLELSLDILRHGPPVLVDPVRLRQVVLNLLGNAVKFTGRGKVSLSLSKDRRGRLKIAVRDTGIGIPKDRVAGLFERFAQADGSITRRYGGTGLGLSISRSIVEAMGGEIGVESVEGAGSTFWFAIDPPEAELALRSHGEARPQPERTRRVLLADDNPLNRELFIALMEGRGLEITQAADGAQAVRAVREGAFDVVFMDVQMPVVDGLEATRTLRACGFDDLPIVALSANVMSAQVEACREAGMNDHLPKPYAAEDVMRLLERWTPAREEAPSAPPSFVAEETLEALRRSIGAARLDGFLDALAGQLRNVAALLAAPQTPEPDLGRAAHSVRGLAGTLGFCGIAETYRLLEEACLASSDVEVRRAEADAATTRTLAEIAQRRAA